MPILASKIRKGQPLTSERRDRDNCLKGKSPTSSQSDLPSPAHCLRPERQGHREGGVTDPCSPSHVWPAEGEESKPSQFRELSLVQGAPEPSQLRVYLTRHHCIDFLSGWTWGRWRGQKLQHKMPSFQQVRLCMKREGKKEDNEEAIERRAHGLLLESSLSLQVVN